MKKFFLILFITIISMPAFAFEKNCFGLYIGNDISKSDLNKYIQLYKNKPCTISLYTDFNIHITADQLNIINSIEAIPVITLEPWFYESKTPADLKDIYKGKYNYVLDGFINLLFEYNKPVFIRFAHEMNGNWYPWGSMNNPEDYVKAYRYVHDYLSNSSVKTNLKWIWSINAKNIPDKKTSEPLNYYPGSAYADYIGIDGYNLSVPNQGKLPDFIYNMYSNVVNYAEQYFNSFDNIFENQIDYIKVKIPEKPIIITEVASAGINQRPAKWISNFFDQLSLYPDIKMFIWFDIKKEFDWRIESDTNSIKAFKKGLKNWINK